MKIVKNTVKTFLFIALMSAGFAHGAQENRGLPFCQDASAVCMDGKFRITVCIFPQNDSAYVSFNNVRSEYRVKEVAPNPKMRGAGDEYVGEGFDLHIASVTLPNQFGYASSLSISRLGIRNVALRCKLRQ